MTDTENDNDADTNNGADALTRFLLGDAETRRDMAGNPDYEADLVAHLGRAGLERYRALQPAEHLALDIAPNVLFVPGVMGSVLMNERLGGIWWVDVRTRAHIDDLGLKADGSGDALTGSLVRAIVPDTSYEPFFVACNETTGLAHAGYAYDWRLPMTSVVDGLADRVAALRADNGGEPVHLVGHSMGGLVVRTALWKRPELWDQIGKVVFVGTPHFGSPAIVGYLKNHFWGFELLALLGRYLSRETLRSLWGVLSLLPAPPGVYPGTRAGEAPWSGGSDDDAYRHPAANFDFYDVDAYGFDDISDEQATRLGTILDWVKQYHTDLAQAHADLPQPNRDRMLMIAGVGQKTLFRLERDKVLWRWDRTRKVTGRRDDDPHREGDGRVPVASAQLPDVDVRYASGVHGSLTNIEEVYEEVFAFLRGEALRLPQRFQGAAHLAGGGESAAPELDGSGLFPATGDDPGYLADEELSDERFAELDAALDRGELGEFSRIRIL